MGAYLIFKLIFHEAFTLFLFESELLDLFLKLTNTKQ